MLSREGKSEAAIASVIACLGNNQGLADIQDLTYEQNSGEKTFQTSMHGDWHWQPALSAG